MPWLALEYIFCTFIGFTVREQRETEDRKKILRKEKSIFKALRFGGYLGQKWRVSHGFSKSTQVIVYEHLKDVERARMDRIEGDVRVIIREGLMSPFWANIRVDLGANWLG